MSYKNKGEPTDKLLQITKQTEDVKNDVRISIEKVIDRGENIDIMLTKSEKLLKDAEEFDRLARKKKQQELWRQRKWVCLKISIVMGILTILSLIIWGATKN
jgi:hypothetical protein